MRSISIIFITNKICRGVLTGLNEAFIIDNETKKRLVSENANSADIIKPILRGKDIQRYQAVWAGEWLIQTHNGNKDKGIEPIDIERHSSIKAHLDGFFSGLENRQDKGSTPYHLRHCTYYSDFNKDKIIWKRVGSIIRFSYDELNYTGLDSTCIAIGSNLKYIVAFLNSEIGNFLLRVRAGDLLISVSDIEPLKILAVTSANQVKISQIESLVDKIIEKKSKQLNTYNLEDKINQLMYKLYGLNSDEVIHLQYFLYKYG